MNSRRRNIELKARCNDLAALRAKARDLGANEIGILRQRDTFFAAEHARLKLREFGDGHAELISYSRPDVATPRASDYFLTAVDRPAEMRAVLEHALGIECTVTKARRLLLLRATRIHLDEVEGLGSFVELETVMSAFDEAAENEAHEELRVIAQALEIESKDCIGVPYAALIQGLALDETFAGGR